MKKKIHWVSWEKMCRLKDLGGVGIKDLGLINKALLNKWNWRILVEEDAIWASLLNHRYGNIRM